jgi:hypothetical protein
LAVESKTVEPDELQQLLRAAAEEHRRTRELLEAHRGPGGLEARLVWIFGSPRSGSTWLLRMLSGRSEVAAIDETYLGAHLVPERQVLEGEYFEHGERAEDPSYFFARRYLPVVRPLLRELVLRGLEHQLRHLRPGLSPRWVAIKEPNGSHAADTIVSLLPSSRMLFLLRDGRDVVDSLVDAMQLDESWWKDKHSTVVRSPPAGVPFVSQHAALWVHRTISSQRAFDALPDEQRLLVRYEELLSDTPAQLQRIFDWLDIDVSEGDLEAIVARYAFKAVPKDRRGPGKPVRAATPGLWRQNRTPEEQQAMHEIMGDKLGELGYEA